MIEAEGLTRIFTGRRGPAVVALAGVSFHVRAGEVVGVIGPNGAGKTTLFRILAGILRPSEGRARIAGFDVLTESLRAREKIGLLTEEPGLPAKLTPLWHVAFHASLRGMPRGEAVGRSLRLLGEMGLEEMAGTPNGSLSKGGRQKVALARALVHEPGALLLDEPTASLDIESAAWLREWIGMMAARGTAVLLATHNPREAEDVCDRLVVLRRGSTVASGTPREIRRRAASSAVVEIRLSGPADRILAAVRRLPRLDGATASGDRLMLPAPGEADRSRLLADLMAAAGDLAILEITDRAPSLEEAYRAIQREADDAWEGGAG